MNALPAGTVDEAAMDENDAYAFIGHAFLL
jgi:hypothetical protein